MFRNINFNIGNKTFCSIKEDTVNKHCSSNFEPIVCSLMKEMNEVSNGKKNFFPFCINDLTVVSLFTLN